MLIPPFRNWRIRAKLISVTLALLLLSLSSIAFLSMNRFGKALKIASEEDLERLVRNIYSMCKVQQEMLEKKVVSDLNVARGLLDKYSPQIEILRDQKLRFDAVNQFNKQVHEVIIPVWKAGNLILSKDNRFVDEVGDLVGGTCAIFQRIENNGLLRISTNIIGKDGKRGIGTFIPSNSDVAKAIISGHPYQGRAYVVDDWYITAYEPLKSPNGEVIGALYVGIMEQSANTLKDEIKQIKVGETGYAYIIDSEGFLKVHPAKEGMNILDTRDTEGFEYIRAMGNDALLLKEGEVGTIRYPWINPELGEKRIRQKINKYIYFKPWDWIIAAGTYEEEIYRSLYKTERFIFAMVFISLVLVFVLTITLSKVLTRPIEELTKVTTKMAEGDLSQRVNIHSTDEIGVLGRSFNGLISQIQKYTSDLEKMVDARTEELKDSREKYRDLSRFLNSILDSSTEYAIIALDFYGKIIEFNKGAEKMFGWEKEEVLNVEKTGITLVPEDLEREIQKEMSKRTRKEGVFEMEMERLRKNGERFPVQTTITAIKDPSGKTTGFVEIVRDLTQRKGLERELRETKEFLENIMESSVDGIATTDLKGKVTYLNRAMVELLGYSRKDIIGEHISRIYFRGIQEARDIMDLLRAVETTKDYEMEVKRKEGEILHILTSLFLLRNEDAEVIGTAGIFKDITKQKSLVEELKATQARLVEASKMRALGELVAGVAHELNNPLMASKTILHVIFNNLPDDFPELERLELIRKCNDRIEKIVEHLREFSRQTRQDFEEIDINQPIENALMITGQQLLNHNIKIIRELSEDLPPIIGDPNQLEQVFLNLISNARDAMDGITDKRELTISSFLTKDEDGLMIAASVKDTGIGIPKENLDKVLEPFFSTKPVGRGTGLGLSLCFGIIEAHGGRLEINSQLGKGTEVTVLFPKKETKKE